MIAARPRNEDRAPTQNPERAAAIAHHFRAKRAEFGESQHAFADRMNIRQGTISEIEQGRCNPKLLTLEEWARRLGMDVADLLRLPEGRQL